MISFCSDKYCLAKEYMLLIQHKSFPQFDGLSQGLMDVEVELLESFVSPVRDLRSDISSNGEVQTAASFFKVGMVALLVRNKGAEQKARLGLDASRFVRRIVFFISPQLCAETTFCTKCDPNLF